MSVPPQHEGLFLLVFLTEEVGVGAGVEHDEDKFLFALLPNEKPVELDVALPLSLAVAVEHVGQVLCWQFALG